MKILYLAHRIPFPPNKGDKIRSFHEIKHFSRNHEIHLCAFCDQHEDLAHAQALKRYCRSVELIPLRPWPQRMRAAISIIQGMPWSVGYFQSSLLRRAIAAKLNAERFDLVFVFASSMAGYAASIRDIPKILDFVDSDAAKWNQYQKMKRAPASWLYGYESKRLALLERVMARQFDFSIFVSRREAQHLQESDFYGKVHFIQNGIDLDYFSPVQRNGSSRSIVFTGVMDYFPNVDAVCYFAREVLPKVRSTFADASFVIVGSRPASAVRRLADLPGVTVTGTVDDVRPFLAASRVAVAPVRISQGIQNKILEALATGLPVVASAAVAEGMYEAADLPLAVARDSREFADRVLQILSQAPLSPSQIERCRQQLKNHYDWDTNLAAFDKLFEAVTSASTASKR